jgi:armadillo repeat-containing protein 8
MTRSLTQDLVLELEGATENTARISILRKLKNEIVGHELRKRECIKYGIVPIISQILLPSKRKTGKRVERDGSHANGFPSQSMNADEVVFIQATCIVGIIAHGW